MPNSEYLRLKALLDANPQYKVMLDAISKAEGTWGKDAYSTKFGGKKVDWRKGKDQKSDGTSNAHGKYQFMNTTWKNLSDTLGLSGFSPEEQDVAALKLLEDNGSLQHIDNGDFDKAIFSSAKTWAALPKDASGRSALKNKNGTPQKAKPLNAVLGYIKSNEAARAEINDKYKKLNQDNVSSKDSRQINKNNQKVKSYWNEINNIQTNKDLSEEEKNVQKHAVKSKYYREGYMSAVNVDINETNKKYDSFINKMKKLSDRDNEALISDDGMINPSAGTISKKEFEDLKKEALQFNIDLGNPNYGVAGGDKKNKNATRYVSPAYIKKKLSEFNSLYTPRQIEPGLLKYGKTKDEYDEEVAKNSPEETSSSLVDDINNSDPTAETPQQKAERLKVETAEKNRGKLQAAQNKPFEGSPILDSLTAQDEWSDPQFRYKPGKDKLPFDALIGLTTGLMGAASADDVHIKYRDEQISQGMLQYAQDIAKIKNMGLSPEIEGSLKMKLQDAYQTGITNLVRASAGNRNLVLGNQGQLDKARMDGIVNIAALDVDRTDKAMAAFGEVQQYINEFDSRRDISNNERRYAEDKQKQASGMQLAQTGMSSFIDAIQNAKENGPGSMNDMRRQLFQFNATGILPDAKEGEVGSLSYREAKTAEHNAFIEKKKTYSDWISGKTTEEKDLINNILEKNPQLNPDVNGKTEFKELEDFYNTVSGTNEYKSDFYKLKNISDLTTSRVQTKVDEVTGEPLKEAPPVEKQYLPSIDAPIKTVPVVQTPAPVPTASRVPAAVQTRQTLPVTQIAPTIVTTEKLPDAILQKDMANMANDKPYGLNNLNPEAVANANRMNKTMQEMDTINRAAQERDLIFNQQQAEAEQKLNSVIH